MIHGNCRRNKQSPRGTHTFALGLRAGYWPCLRAPFVQISLGPWVMSGWVGKGQKEDYQGRPCDPGCEED